MHSIFHLAFNVTDLDTACEFYSNILGCQQGRKTDSWVDYNFFGHQLSLHLGQPFHVEATGKVDNIAVPMPHFGAILSFPHWNQLAQKLQNLQLDFIIAPSIRFEGQAGEQHTMFFTDPFGNPIELKSFADPEQVFNV
ncbi:VOC family protein [Marinomonas sp. 15G1-11]|uniref:VOC family protein n=1 Tax=Marinomonas phaeophyticola TaxID=3004091 RepID=A0ABT4JYJ4_9GAMM|nr:VOC family protein [Marinomonas sp. 15G1-11]MCZ2723455.1 VOC family protein [Marinomonas sp. 15G1-11]